MRSAGASAARRSTASALLAITFMVRARLQRRSDDAARTETWLTSPCNWLLLTGGISAAESAVARKLTPFGGGPQPPVPGAALALRHAATCCTRHRCLSRYCRTVTALQVRCRGSTLVLALSPLALVTLARDERDDLLSCRRCSCGSVDSCEQAWQLSGRSDNASCSQAACCGVGRCHSGY